MPTQQAPNPYANNATNTEPVFEDQKNNSLAIASLILGVLSVFLYFLTAIPGIITGHMARSRVKRNPESYDGKGMALAGLILSYMMLLISLALIIGTFYLFNKSPEIKDAFMEGMKQGFPTQ